MQAKRKPVSIEKKLERRLRMRAKKNKWECLKMRIVGQNGFMDDMLIAKGQVYFIEFKDEDTWADPVQASFRDRLLKVGTQPLLINSAEKLDRFTYFLNSKFVKVDITDMYCFTKEENDAHAWTK